jgi:hypothetical protein
MLAGQVKYPGSLRDTVYTLTPVYMRRKVLFAVKVDCSVWVRDGGPSRDVARINMVISGVDRIFGPLAARDTGI